MNLLDQALDLAAHGFHVFPLEENGKLPKIKDYPNRATTNEAQVRKWFSRACNIGISTTHWADHSALLVVDVDNKNGKDGDASILALEMEGFEFPLTFEQTTPTGGRHLVYSVSEALKQGVDVLGSGLDIRSRGGYIVAPGSVIDGRAYTMVEGRNTVAPAPQWLIDKVGRAIERAPNANVMAEGVDPTRAEARAIKYLKTAPIAIESQGGDLTTFKVAAKLKDLGVREAVALDLLIPWNERCDPPWLLSELATKVKHVYKYGKEPAGSAAPEAAFPATETPVEVTPEKESRAPLDAMNAKYAYVIAGGGAHILHETTNQEGKFDLQHLAVGAFHGFHANQLIQTDGKRAEPISEMWLRWSKRRTYEGLVFEPSGCDDPRFYNMWRGFSCEPAETGDHWAVDLWKEHALQNVCDGNKQHCHWLISWFAHIIQHPEEKPLVALVLRGAKGTGKNALVERVGELLGSQFFMTANRRYLTSNFTGHLEKCLMFGLDEAFWSGDKQAEGIVKDLVTGSRHVIEHKGKEPYTVRNLTRVVIIGNENWVVPATHDERRWAVFNVGAGRCQDRDFFRRMREGLEQGGNRHLLRFLMDYPLADINAAPATKGLQQQKLESLEPFDQWWFECLSSGGIVGSDFTTSWPAEIPINKLQSAYQKHLRDRNIRTRAMTGNAQGAALKKMMPSIGRTRFRVEKVLTYHYVIPELDVARQAWDTYIGSPTEWEQ